jgi:CubicO group peptidase (beta-lactamase class C family)
MRRLGCWAGALVILVSLAAPRTVLAPKPGRPSRLLPAMNFQQAVESAGELSRLYSLTVEWRGQILVDEYFHGKTARSLANLKSASKSVLAALIGIAINRGVIPDVDMPIARYFPDLADPEKQRITVKNLLMMRSGLETTSNRFYGAWVASANWVRFALNQPLLSPPGEQMIYSTGNTHLLSAILTKSAGMSTWEFAQDALAGPLGFDLPRWPTDPQGIYFGGNDMLMTPHEMLKIGELYLHSGRYNGRQVVPAEWVEASCNGPAREGRPGQSYGYGWWGGEFRSYKTCYAWGYGGQYIWVIPELDLVMVATSSPDVGDDRFGYRRQLFDLVEEDLVAPIASRQAWERYYHVAPGTSSVEPAEFGQVEATGVDGHAERGVDVHRR